LLALNDCNFMNARYDCKHEREGSRIQVLLGGKQWRAHRPHPGKEAKRYQVEEARELRTRTGNQP
jgi:hypothetical protein